MSVPRRLDKMVESGRVTAEEADRLRTGDPEVVDGTVVGIRARHARSRLDAAVAAGAVSRQEAERILTRVWAGEHSPELRALLNRFARIERSDGAEPPKADSL